MSRNPIWSLAAALAVCTGATAPAFAQNLPFTVTQVADFDIPWAMAFLPDGRMLVTEQRGMLKLYTPGGASVDVRGVPRGRAGSARAAWATSCCIPTSRTTGSCT